MPISSALGAPPGRVLVEVLAYAPTQFFHCQHCEFIWQQAGAGAAIHQEQLDASIPDDLKREYAELSAWVYETIDTYGDRVVIKIIDAASMEGLWKAVRYNLHRFPAFVVGGKEKQVGMDFTRVRGLIEKQLGFFHSSSPAE
jgi:hypothetical protein